MLPQPRCKTVEGEHVLITANKNAFNDENVWRHDALIFQTRRLRVRPLQDSDFDAFHEMQSNPTVMRFTTGQALSYEENRNQLTHCISSYRKPGNQFWVWAVESIVDCKFVGTCAIVPSENRAEIGYRLLESQFGQGFGQEICNGLIDHAIHSMSAKEIVAVADCRNIASVKILDRSILPFVGEKKDAESGVVDRCYHWKLN